MFSSDIFYKRGMYLVLAVSAGLMLSLALVNDGSANDNHIEVAELILSKGTSPEYKDCWQCYHPKFYHYTLVTLWEWFDTSTKESRAIIAQIINALAGVSSLSIILLFILAQPFKRVIQFWSFALIALNPKFIVLHGQASNDAFVILFGTVLIFALFHCLRKPSWLTFSIVTLFAILAGITKGNSFVLIAGVVTVLLFKMISSFQKNQIVSLLFFLIVNLLAIGYFGGYYDNYKKHGHPFMYNTPVGEAPYFFEKTTVLRPGVRSVAEGYFTFRLFDLLEMPLTNNDFGENYRLHRTSVWSQLYARTHFFYFDNWPPGVWQTNDSIILNIGRCALVLGLLPTLLFIFGFFKSLNIWWKIFLRKNLSVLKSEQDWMFSIFNIGFLVFLILFTLFGRDYSFMKIIYLFPAILAAAIPLLVGLQSVFQILRERKKLRFIFQLNLSLLIFCYTIPVLHLINNLATN